MPSSFSADSPTCHSPSIAPSPNPVTGEPGSPTFRTIAIIISVISITLSFIIAIGQVINHLRNCTNVVQQKVYIRIILLPPTFGIFYMFSAIWYGVEPCIEQIAFIYEAVCVCSLFDLFVVTVAGPNRLEQEIFFQNLGRWNRHGKKEHENGSLRWFKYVHWAVYQFPITCALTALADILNAALVCSTSKLSLAIKILVQIITILATVMTLGAFLPIYRRLRLPLRKAGMLSKFVALKLLVLVVSHQRFVFNIIVSANVFTPTSTLSYGDFSIGLLALLTAGEMVFKEENVKDGTSESQGFVEMGHWPSDAPSGSSLQKHRLGQKVPFVQAYVAAFNWMDLFRGMWISFKELKDLVTSKKYTVDVTPRY